MIQAQKTISEPSKISNRRAPTIRDKLVHSYFLPNGGNEWLKRPTVQARICVRALLVNITLMYCKRNISQTLNKQNCTNNSLTATPRK